MNMLAEQYEWCWNFATRFRSECELCPHRKECTVYRKAKKLMDECSNCEYYNKEDDICMAMDCTPITDCTAPLPCEEKEESNEKNR